MNNTKTKLYLAIVVILGALIVLYVLSSSLVPQLLVTRSKAALSGKISLASSYILGGKTLARADGKDKCVVNVFVRDSNDLGIVGRNVELVGAANISPTQATTNGTGMATFEISSLRPGQFEITATVDGIEMTGKSVRVSFN